MKWIVALLVAVPLVLSFLPGLPTHGYGLVLLGLLPLYYWRRPAHRPRLLAYAAAIGIGTLAWPDPDLGFLGWVLLLPYLWARERDDGANWWRSAFLFGFMRAIAGFYWLGNVHFTAWVGTCVLSGVGFVVGYELVLRRARFMPFALRGAIGWLLFEWMHGWLGGGFPWRYIAHTQHDYLPLIQIVALFGVPALSFLMAFSQHAVYEAWKARRQTRSLRLAAFSIGLVAAYGFFRLGSAPTIPDDAPTILLVQTAAPQSLKEQRFDNFEAFERRLRADTVAGIKAHPEAQLVVWPETMFPLPYLEDATDTRYSIERYARRLARSHGRAAIYGVNSYPDYAAYKTQRGYNSALLVRKDGSLGGLYRKQWLVPMGEEFLPRRVLSDAWSDSFMDFLQRTMGYPGTSDMYTGAGAVTLDAGPGLRCAMSICFEGLSPGMTATSAQHEDPDLILNLVNNAWFAKSWEERQMLAIFQFRAVETGLPFVSCVNGGVSGVIAPSGEVVASLDQVMEPGVLAVRVPPAWGATVFLKGGCWALPAALFLAALGFFLSERRRKSNAPQKGP